ARACAQGGPIRAPSPDHALQDPEVTLALSAADPAGWRPYVLPPPLDKLSAPASIGKAALQEMGLPTPPKIVVGESLQRTAEPPTAADVQGWAQCAYYAGRSEAHIVKVDVPVAYPDATSMYPTSCARQGLWDWMRAEELVAEDTTDEARHLLTTLTPDDLYDSQIWPKLPILCLV